MDPYPVREREFPIDPYYAPVKCFIYSIKVIPVVDRDAQVFPSWAERKLVRLELIFNPFTLETTVLLHEREDIEVGSDQPSRAGKSDAVVICSSFFFPVMATEKQLHIELYRFEGTGDKVVGFRGNQCSSSLTGGIAGRILAALAAAGNEVYPSLELCFEKNEDAKAFLRSWSLAFGREVDQAKLKENMAIFENYRHYGSKNFAHPPVDSIVRRHIGTPVSLQTPANASSHILSHLLYEKALLITESNLSLDEPGFSNLRCYHRGYTIEVFIPYRKLLKCQIPKYPKLNWCVEVTSTPTKDLPPELLTVKIEDCSTRNIRQPLLHLAERRNYIDYLMQDKKIDSWLKTNKESYWWVKFSYSPYSISEVESQAGMVNIRFPPSHPNCAAYTQPILDAFNFAHRHPRVFVTQKACTIEKVFLGYRHGRLLPDRAVKETNLVPPMYLLAEQAKVFNHVLSHDFTVVDGAPGTGKSRVAADIILAFLLAGKKVLVMTTSDNTLDFLATSVLNAMPEGDARTTEVARLRAGSRHVPKLPIDHAEAPLESVSIAVSFKRPPAYGGKPPYSLSPSAALKERLEKIPVIFMTTNMAERIDPFYGVGARHYDLVVLDDANTCNESLGLQLSQNAFAGATRWLVIGCSKGISPGVNIDEFKEMEICGSWHTRLLRHPEFRFNPLRLTKQSRVRKALYEPINNMCFGGTITYTPDCPQEEGDHELCMGFVNSARVCRKKGRTEVYDEEILEMINYRKEVSFVLSIALKIHRLTPHALIVVMCHTEQQKHLMYSELERARDLTTATIAIQTIDEFVNKEAIYAIVHLPLWKDSYAYTGDLGRFVTAMTRARKGAFVVGNLPGFAAYEDRRGTWKTNPWRVWMMEMNKSAHGAVFEDVAELNLTINATDLAAFKKARSEVGRWLEERYTKEELVKLKSYW